MKPRKPMWVYVVHCKEADESLSAYAFAEELPAESWAERLIAEEQVVGVNVQRMQVLDAVPGRERAH